MPTIVSKNKSLPLNIIGASGYTSILSTTPFYLKSDISSGNIPLYMKQTVNSGILQAETNWDFSLASNSKINHFSNGDIEYVLTDYSSNRYDSYYNSNRGTEAVEYTLSHDWSINAIDATEEVLALGTKGWTSFEKYTLDISDYSIYSVYISEVFYYDIPPPTTETVTVYNFTIHWDSKTSCGITTPGNIVVGYINNGQYLTDVTYVVDNDTDDIGPLQATAWPPTITWTGNIGDEPCIEPPIYTTSTETIVTPANLPNDAIIIDSNRYIRTSDINPKISKYIIPLASDLFKDRESNWMNINSSNFEVPDYSDIHIRIVYDSSPINSNQTKLLQPVTTTGNEEKIYKFGGFLKIQDFYNGLYDNATLSSKLNIDSEYEYLWYIIIKDDGTYCFIGLSSYTTWEYSFDINFPVSQNNLITEDHLIVGWKKPSFRLSEAIKVAGFPNCGKVDIFFPKYGNVENFVSGEYTITSPNHGLASGDRVKFTEALGSGTTLNGLKYALPINNDNFNIYYDRELSYPAYINDTYSSTGVRWSVVDGQTWSYGFTLYSPTDKNGYGTSLSLITANEPPVTGETPLQRAIETTTEKPQYDFTGQRSWTNYYPFERFDSTEGTIFGVVNGNKFGSSVSLKKYGTDYILMVTEEGANESFQIISSFETVNDGLPKPHNKRVIPSFFPYGRVHFYKITPSTKSIEYITSYSSSDNPWASYEIVNRQERILGQESKFSNKQLTSSDLATYNNTSSNYWNGAKLMQWSRDYFYDSDIGFSFPNQNSYPYDYGFVDRLKSADFEINGDTIYAVTVSNVKNADFLNYSRLKNVDQYFRTISFDITLPSSKSTTLYTINTSSYSTSDLSAQKEEYDYFANKVIVKNSGLYFGWASDYRTEEYVYYYKRTGSQYELKDLIISSGTKGFGDYLAVDNGFLLTNKYSYTDENGNPTTNPLDSIQVYKYDGKGDQYYYAGSLTPTIDLSNPLYADINSSRYELTTNLSYDGTSENSATYIINLDNNYDIKDDMLVIRDWYEYAGFKYDYTANKFINKFHKLSPRSTENSILKISKGLQTTFFDDRVEYDLGSYHKSLQIFDVSQIDENSLNNYLFTIDTHYPQYVPLFLKTIEGYSSGNLNLKGLGHDVFSTGVALNLQAPIPTGTGVNLFVKQIDIQSTGLNLFHKSTSIESGNATLFIRNGIYETGVPLVMNPAKREYFPLYLEQTVVTTFIDSELALSLYSTFNVVQSPRPSAYSEYDPLVTPVVPENYLVVPFYIQTIPYSDHADSIPLGIFAPGTGISSDISLYQNAGGVSGSVFNNSTLYMNASGYQGYGNSGILNLWMQRPITDSLPLIVYNTMETGNIPLFCSGANFVGTEVTLNISGYHRPSGTITLYSRGDL